MTELHVPVIAVEDLRTNFAILQHTRLVNSFAAARCVGTPPRLCFSCCVSLAPTSDKVRSLVSSPCSKNPLRAQTMHPSNLRKPHLQDRWKLTCSLCETREGACIKCSAQGCNTPLHPFCCRKEGLPIFIMPTQKGPTHVAYCRLHADQVT
jgi:hypothetical protein